MILFICLIVFILLLLWFTQETLTEKTPIQIYPNKIKNRIVFKINTGHRLELLSLEKVKLLVSTKKDVDQDKDGED